jgi:hypothetical protein
MPRTNRSTGINNNRVSNSVTEEGEGAYIQMLKKMEISNAVEKGYERKNADALRVSSVS